MEPFLRGLTLGSVLVSFRGWVCVVGGVAVRRVMKVLCRWVGDIWKRGRGSFLI